MFDTAIKDEEDFYSLCSKVDTDMKALQVNVVSIKDNEEYKAAVRATSSSPYCIFCRCSDHDVRDCAVCSNECLCRLG